MDFNCHIAMTAIEFLRAKAYPPHFAWMACHFSQRNAGLCDLPDMLPDKAVLILDDSTPLDGHDPELVSAQLCYFIKRLQAETVILDFQTPDQAETLQMTDHLINKLPCTVCVAAPYAQQFSCPVLLPAPAHHVHLAEHLSCWSGREIWLEATLDTEKIIVTEQGSSILPLPYQEPQAHWFTEKNLHCRYQIRESENAVEFILTRDKEMLEALLKEGHQQGVHHFLGLYQQLGFSFP